MQEYTIKSIKPNIETQNTPYKEHGYSEISITMNNVSGPHAIIILYSIRVKETPDLTHIKAWSRLVCFSSGPF